MRILLVEDEPAVREMTVFALERAGFTVDEAGDAEEALRMLDGAQPDLILLDWMMPGVSGLELARQLRRQESTSELPIIMLTAKAEEVDTLKGFDAGVDDYISKPFSPKELVARIKAVLRRTTTQSDEGELGEGDLKLDPRSHRVTIDGETLDIGPTEFRLLRFFLSHKERVFSRGQLLDRVWGTAVYIEERTVDVHIRRLRKALEPSGHDRFIQTVRGAGYRFSAQD